MPLLDWAGAASTLLALALLLVGGYLGALALLRAEAQRDRLALATASLLLAMGQAIVVAIVLGALGVLRLQWALALQAGLVASLVRPARRAASPARLGEPAQALAVAVARRAREHPVLCLVLAHAAGSEALRGLLRPPLAWDALMYHLLLSATWLRDGNLMPVLGNVPVNYYGYAPANASLWWWWWMAPSHSELYVNVAAVPHWVLLGLAAGGLARHLGAERWWPAASFLLLGLPTVVRFVATQYADLMLAAALLAGLLFGLRWARRPRWSDALLAAAGLGLAAGTKVIGVPYALAAVATILALARGSWARRLGQAVACLLVAASLGSFFYLRNIALGVDPLALECERTAAGRGAGELASLPRPHSVAALAGPMFVEGQLLDAFLGVPRPRSLEMGVGPVALPLLLGLLAVPWALRGGSREGTALLLLSALIGAFWAVVPFAGGHHVFGNVRYLVPVLGIACAVGVAALARRPPAARWLPWIVLVFAIQGLLQLHTEMPRAVRLAMAGVDTALVALAASPRLRLFARRRWRWLLAGAAATAFLFVPVWSRFRIDDRGRALATESTIHHTAANRYAAAWAWLDRHGGEGNVAAVGEPMSLFIYPAMGPRLQRDVRVVNPNRADLPYAAAYPGCQPRVDPEATAWLDSLRRRRIRWVHLMRAPGHDFPLEDRWARGWPRLFVRRHADPASVVYELRAREPGSPGAGSSEGGPPR